MDTLIAKDGLKLEYKKLILKAIDYHFPQARVVLFGSRARGSARIRVTLENLPLALDIDVVDMHNIPTELKNLILKEGIVWKN